MLALLPLDDRPCNARFPIQIAAIGGDEMLAPPLALLGRFNAPGQSEKLGEWLRDLPEISALIVSVDMLAYGGLVASRKPTASVGEALARLQILKDFRAARPDTKIYGFNILMRLAVTMDGDAAVANYYNIMRWARLSDEAERFDSDHLRDELNKVRGEIAPAVLDEYLKARARNHAINLSMLQWLDQGVFDYLLITQEDASEFGLHRREQESLLQRARELNVTEKMSLHPGADEAALTLLARDWNTDVRFRLHPSSAEDMKRIAPFEDRPYDQALNQHIAASRGVLLAQGDESTPDFHLFVHAPVGGSQKDEDDSARALRLARLMPWIREMIEIAESGGCIALCDVAFPNGADNALMGELEKRKALGKIAVFGGWNTAGNTTGTVLAQCAALKNAKCGVQSAECEKTASLSRAFTFERLVDDWYYQAQVRARIEKSARESGVSPLKMTEESVAPIEAQARRELRGFAQLLARRQFGTTVHSAEIALPWSRSFEADVRVELA